MSYGPVPCDDKPQFMDSSPTQSYVEHDGQIIAAVSAEPLLETITDELTKAEAKILADAMIAGLEVPVVTVDIPADSEEEACGAALAVLGNPEGVACAVAGEHKRRSLASNTYTVELYINPTIVDEAAM